MSLLSDKIITMVLMGLVSFILGIIPLKASQFLGWSKTGKKRNLLTSILLCFGGGVLIATCFLHIIPEVEEGLIHSKKTFDEFSPIVLTMILICSGFFAIYLLEEIVTFIFTKGISKKFVGQVNQTSAVTAIISSNFSISTNVPSVPDGTIEEATESSTPVREDRGDEVCNPKYAGHLSDTTKSMFPNYHSPEETATRPVNPVRLRDLLTVLALSFHTIFEGLAIGVETNKESIWKLFTAIAMHQYVIIFCIGMELVLVKTAKVAFYSYIVSLSLMSPLGIAIGIIITQSLSENHFLIIAILQGFAAGTIIYVVMFEILAVEKAKTNVSGLVQFSSAIFGFLVMFIIQYLSHHIHAHAHSSHKEVSLDTDTGEEFLHPLHVHQQSPNNGTEYGLEQ